jgi:hypothetical protein
VDFLNIRKELPMTTTAERRVPLPRGAVSTEDWQPNDGGHYYRNFEGERRAVAAGTLYGADVIVYAHGVQHDDGTIIDNGVTDPVFEPPSISMSTVNGDVQTDPPVSPSPLTLRGVWPMCSSPVPTRLIGGRRDDRRDGDP